MRNLLPLAQKAFLYPLLVLIGLYAGMLFNHKLCPVETQLSPLDYARYWKIVDGTFMHTVVMQATKSGTFKFQFPRSN